MTIKKVRLKSVPPEMKALLDNFKYGRFQFSDQHPPYMGYFDVAEFGVTIDGTINWHHFNEFVDMLQDIRIAYNRAKKWE